MEEVCNHIGFTIEYDNHYECTKCGKIGYKYLSKGIDGVWCDCKEPQEITVQKEFEKVIQMQQHLKKED